MSAQRVAALAAERRQLAAELIACRSLPQGRGVGDRLGEVALLPLEPVANVTSEGDLVDGDDVVAADQARLIQAVGRPERDLGAEAFRRRGDRATVTRRIAARTGSRVRTRTGRALSRCAM